jgi:hypothetical protein
MFIHYFTKEGVKAVDFIINMIKDIKGIPGDHGYILAKGCRIIIFETSGSDLGCLRFVRFQI